MLSLPFVSTKLEIAAIPTAAGSYRFVVCARHLDSKNGRPRCSETTVSTFDSALSICDTALRELALTCGQFIATNTDLSQPSEPDA